MDAEAIRERAKQLSIKLSIHEPIVEDSKTELRNLQKLCLHLNKGESNTCPDCRLNIAWVGGDS
jgi:hypothetical protein